MNSNLPVRQNYSLWEKIKNFFKRKFLKESKRINDENKIEERATVNNIQKNFLDKLNNNAKEPSINYVEREKFLDNIEKNPKLLYSLPIEKLRMLENYYEESIKIYEKKLARIKKYN